MSIRRAIESTRKSIQEMIDDARKTKEEILGTVKEIRPTPLKNIVHRRLRKRD